MEESKVFENEEMVDEKECSYDEPDTITTELTDKTESNGLNIGIAIALGAGIGVLCTMAFKKLKAYIKNRKKKGEDIVDTDTDCGINEDSDQSIEDPSEN